MSRSQNQKDESRLILVELAKRLKPNEGLKILKPQFEEAFPGHSVEPFAKRSFLFGRRQSLEPCTPVDDALKVLGDEFFIEFLPAEEMFWIRRKLR